MREDSFIFQEKSTAVTSPGRLIDYRRGAEKTETDIIAVVIAHFNPACPFGHQETRGLLFPTYVPMPSVERLHVSICDTGTGSDLEEYKVLTVGSETECWVESKEGSLFSIRMDVGEQQRDLPDCFLFRVHVDGHLVDKLLLGEHHDMFRRSKVVTGVYKSEEVIKPFTFGKALFGGRTIRVIFLMRYRRLPIGKRYVQQFGGYRGHRGTGTS